MYVSLWYLSESNKTRLVKGRIHCEIFLSEHFMKYSFRESFHEKWDTFMKYFYFSIHHSLRMFLINKNCVYREKISCKFNSIEKYLLLIKQKQKNSKIPKRICLKPCLKTRSGKSACANIFLELSLTNSGIILEWMQHHATDHTFTFIHWLLIMVYLLTLTILIQTSEQNS